MPVGVLVCEQCWSWNSHRIHTACLGTPPFPLSRLQRKALKLASERLLGQKQPTPVGTGRRTQGQRLKAAAAPGTQGGAARRQGAGCLLRVVPGALKGVCMGGSWCSERCLPLNESAPHLGSLLPQGKAPFPACQVPGGVLLGVCALWH